MYEDVFFAIRRCYGSLSHVERDIADFVLDHAQEVLHMSISTLAQTCGVGDSTVFRFCRRLGVDGYRDFRTALALSLNSHSTEEPAASGPLEAQMLSVYNGCVRALNETCRLLRQEQLDAAVRRLRASDRILLMGAGRTLVAVINAYEQLSPAVPGVCCALDPAQQRRQCDLLGEGDAVIAFADDDTPPAMLRLISQVHARGCFVLLLAATPGASLNTSADTVLLCGAPHGAEATLRAQQAFVVELLCRLYCQRGEALCPILPQLHKKG